MTFKLPELPYAYDALQPHMSKETLEFHHDKHHQAYVDNGNKLIAGPSLDGKSIEDICKEAFAGKNAGLVNNIGQHYNHMHFWNWMKPNGGGKKIPGQAGEARRTNTAASTRCAPTSSTAGIDAVRLGLVLARDQGRQARSHQDRPTAKTR